MFHLFDVSGIELEYMIVDRSTLDVRPISDVVLQDAEGKPVSDIERGPISWSNELTHHVIELKTTEPTRTLVELASEFQKNVVEINGLLEAANARLLPTAMHPWMNPDREMRLWPHEYHAVYEAFHNVFDCRGHGWANLQSMHINLPFADDDEFARLHAAIRIVLPLLPALAASSPYVDAQTPGKMDCRLDSYRNNAGRVPSVAGRVIPEQVFDRESYDREIFQPMYREVASFDPEGILRNEFLNARGAIARFGRGAIEIRVIDVQECPQADLAIAAVAIEVLKALVSQEWSETAEQQAATIDQLEPVLLAAIDQAEEAVVSDPRLLRLFGVSEKKLSLREIWLHLLEAVAMRSPLLSGDCRPALDVILNEGCLARRILRAADGSSRPDILRGVYGDLADCLHRGELFRA